MGPRRTPPATSRHLAATALLFTTGVTVACAIAITCFRHARASDAPRGAPPRIVGYAPPGGATITRPAGLLSAVSTAIAGDEESYAFRVTDEGGPAFEADNAAHAYQATQ